MKIYYLRHTDADDDRRDSFGGVCDDPLIDAGKNYAKKVAKILKHKNIALIYSSPYMRASETAEIISAELGVSVVEVFNLRERNSYGVVSGMEKDRAKVLFPDISDRILKMKSMGMKPSNSYESLPGSEIYLELVLRAKDSLNQIMRESRTLNYDSIAVVTHGGFSWAFFKDVLGIEMELEKGQVVVLSGSTLENLRIDEEETRIIRESQI